MHPSREGDIWTDFISGSQEAYKVLYDTYADVLYAFGLRYTTDQDQIKDCIHDLFVDLHTYRARLSPTPNNVKFYLLSSFKRKLNQARRQTLLFRPPRRLDSNPALPEFTLSIEHDLISGETERETLEALFYHLNQLPSRQREILYLKFKHELDYQEISALMHISIPTCRTLVYRAVKQLRQQFRGVPVAYLIFLC